jgi:hypothetical protein
MNIDEIDDELKRWQDILVVPYNQHLSQLSDDTGSEALHS